MDDERDDNDDDDDGDDDAVAINGSDDGEGNLCYDASLATVPPTDVYAVSGFRCPSMPCLPSLVL